MLALNEPARVDDDYRDILKLALYEGLRRDEVGKLGGTRSASRKRRSRFRPAAPRMASRGSFR